MLWFFWPMLMHFHNAASVVIVVAAPDVMFTIGVPIMALQYNKSDSVNLV